MQIYFRIVQEQHKLDTQTSYITIYGTTATDEAKYRVQITENYVFCASVVRVGVQFTKSNECRKVFHVFLREAVREMILFSIELTQFIRCREISRELTHPIAKDVAKADVLSIMYTWTRSNQRLTVPTQYIRVIPVLFALVSESFLSQKRCNPVAVADLYATIHEVAGYSIICMMIGNSAT